MVSLPNRLRWGSIIVLLAVALTGCASTTGQQPSEPQPTTTPVALPPAASPTPTDLAPPAPTATEEPSPTPTLSPTDQPLPSSTAAVELFSTATATAALSSTATSAPTAVAATVTAEPTTASLADSDAIAAGLKVYKEQYCGICHKLDVAGTGGIFGPEQNHLGTTAETRLKSPTYRGQAGTAADYLRESILDPAAYFVEGYEQSAHQMPAYTHLSDAQVDALVQMLLQQK
ncbi:MAG: c-type cytochrome [Anaerolineaceae bacterium]|nr:c-type cytochrome [Anaerolineaceae bacterium]MCB9098218.1 c-type cytochrome [Anaerolineales bacterium]